MTKTNSSEEVEASWLLVSKGEKKKKKKKKKVAAVRHEGEEKNSKQDKTDLIGNSASAALWDGR